MASETTDAKPRQYRVEWIGFGNSIEFYNDDPVVYDATGEGVAYCKDEEMAERIARLLNEDTELRSGEVLKE